MKGEMLVILWWGGQNKKKSAWVIHVLSVHAAVVLEQKKGGWVSEADRKDRKSCAALFFYRETMQLASCPRRRDLSIELVRDTRSGCNELVLLSCSGLTDKWFKCEGQRRESSPELGKRKPQELDLHH